MITLIDALAHPGIRNILTALIQHLTYTSPLCYDFSVMCVSRTSSDTKSSHEIKWNYTEKQ